MECPSSVVGCRPNRYIACEDDHVTATADFDADLADLSTPSLASATGSVPEPVAAALPQPCPVPSRACRRLLQRGDERVGLGWSCLQVAHAPKSGSADPAAASRAKNRNLPPKAAEEPLRSTSGRDLTQHAYFSDTEAMQLRDKSQSPQDTYKPMSLSDYRAVRLHLQMLREARGGVRASAGSVRRVASREILRDQLIRSCRMWRRRDCLGPFRWIARVLRCCVRCRTLQTDLGVGVHPLRFLNHRR